MNKIHLISIFAPLIICCLGFAACNNPRQDKTSLKAASTDTIKVQRFGMVTGLKPEKMAYYKKLHAAVWPGVLKKIKECNIRNYSIYVQKIDGKYFLFSYFEYTGQNFDQDMAKMAGDTTTQRWWKETNPAQIPLPEAAARKQIWQNMEEVFHF
ncbi:L-rhamnose mutarotase [Mucilaginibacter sp. SP1R1]|uniref:L-rhamnose mutarotase n=1 Tax=Mucilaginibacter sp. SP1R1 TaxID=2723091 RepID=UPI00161247EB|nr:L-rhamnose mutarotase [Mucilaginibacter sp. SP1R1]MBB6149665.1 L-rhamnose mutarotase [Mucilaginibacter sp. SP1R1]